MSFPRKLHDLFNDLMTEEHSDQFIARVLRRRAGAWISLRRLCRRFAGPCKILDEIGKKLDAPPMVTWMNFPFVGYPEGEEVLLILCFVGERLACKVAATNRGLALSRDASSVAKPRW